MTTKGAKKDLGRLDEEMAETLDVVAKRAFGRTLTEALETHTCVVCGGPAIEFENDECEIEWRITGLCQPCQDKVL